MFVVLKQKEKVCAFAHILVYDWMTHYKEAGWNVFCQDIMQPAVALCLNTKELYEVYSCIINSLLFICGFVLFLFSVNDSDLNHS